MFVVLSDISPQGADPILVKLGIIQETGADGICVGFGESDEYQVGIVNKGGKLVVCVWAASVGGDPSHAIEIEPVNTVDEPDEF